MLFGMLMNAIVIENIRGRIVENITYDQFLNMIEGKNIYRVLIDDK